MGRQFWLGPARAGQTVRFWASVDVIHLTVAGARVKSLRSHPVSTSDLARLAGEGAVPGWPSAAAARPIDGAAIEVDRAVNNGNSGRPCRPTDPGRRDPRRAPGNRPRRSADADVPGPRHARAAPGSGRTRSRREQVLRLQGARPAGPPPRPRTEPITVQRRVSATGVIWVCRQRVALGRVYAGRTVTRPRLRAHARRRARRRNAHDPSHHQPARSSSSRANRPHQPRPGTTSTELSASADHRRVAPDPEKQTATATTNPYRT